MKPSLKTKFLKFTNTSYVRRFTQITLLHLRDLESDNKIHKYNIIYIFSSHKKLSHNKSYGRKIIP